ncbi:MAG: DUF58 domain-containing protein [Clostridia bacterium]|nr:DUF58 domain-containing protein [Clostridia bacterium]MBQ2706988.1 DUF58 domain-containing protein [Clostridia bacterium]
MLFVAVAVMLIIAYFVQMRVYKKRTFERLSYKASLDSTEAVVGDDIYMFEELTNEKVLPLPYIKVCSNMPEGLSFRLSMEENGKLKEMYAPAVESMFVMKGRQRIKRRWRIACRKRGVYTLGDVVIVANDLIGYNAHSAGLAMPKLKSTTVTVLPASVDLERDFTSTKFFSGDIITNQSLLTDPMLRAGAREYTPLDPMNRINWKLTASHARLMVNVEECVQKIQSNVILNMCSHMIERDPTTPANPEFIEYNITVAASLLERFAAANIPVRLIANTPPETIHADFIAGSDETGKQILITPPFSGKNGLLEAMRTLAMLEMKISMPAENLLDYILTAPHLFAENGNVVFVTAVLDDRMLLFHEQMKKKGVEVIFYVTTSNRGTYDVPPDVKVFYRTWFDSYKGGGVIA